MDATMPNQDKATTGLKTAVTILGKWGATTEQGTAILNVSPGTYRQAKRHDPEWRVSLDDDQLTRISYVLNIHASLRVIFDNPENLYGFMSMANHNEGFNGQSALEVIANSDIAALRETWLRVNMERPMIVGDEGRFDDLVAEPSANEKRATAVLDAAEQVCGSKAQARHWFHNEPIDVFDYQTAEQLVASGRADDLLRYLRSLEAGWNG